MPSYCSNCQTVEGSFREPTEQELFEMQLDPDQFYRLKSSHQRDLLVCEACDEGGTYRCYEHDDGEER